MPGYNAQTYTEEFTREFTNAELTRKVSPSVSSTEMFRRLNESLRVIQARYKISTTRQTPGTDIENGVSVYDLPANRQGRDMQQIGIFRPDGLYYPLQRVSWLEMINMFQLTQSSLYQGQYPAFWAIYNVPSGDFGQLNARQIKIWPPPAYDYDGGLVFDYPYANSQLSRIQNNGTSQCNVTFNSAIVTIEPGSLAQAFPGDEFGIIVTTNTDGGSVASTVSPPTVQSWYGTTAIDTDDVGIELVTNGTFTGSLTGWTASNFSASGNKAVYSGGTGTSGSLAQTITTVVDSIYRLTFTISAWATPALVATVTGSDAVSYSSNGAKSIDFTATSTSTVLSFTKTTVGVADVTALDNVSVVKLATIRLAEPYQQLTSTLNLFILAQVPDIEFATPQGVGFAPVWWALADQFFRSSPDLSVAYRQRAIEMLNTYMPGEFGEPGWSWGAAKILPSLGTESQVRNWPVGSGSWNNRIGTTIDPGNWTGGW